MSIADIPFVIGPPGHDESPVKVFKRAQIALLCDVLTPGLNRLHPDGNYYVGTDAPICWHYATTGTPAKYVSPG